MNYTETIQVLRMENEEFRRLEKEHRDLDESILQLDKMRFLTMSEDIERKKLQKLKLYKKDKMAAMIRDYEEKNYHNN